MFKESKGLEYTIEVLNVLSNGDTVDARGISHVLNKERGMESSPTYLSKMLRRMVKIGLLSSSDKGYKLAIDIDSISVGKVLEFSVDPLELNKTVLGLTESVVRHMSTIPLNSIFRTDVSSDNHNEQPEFRSEDTTGTSDDTV